MSTQGGLQDLFSVIVLHYNQQKFLETSLSSVLSQDYSNIELIFADDASVDLDEQFVKDFINKHKKDNIKNILFQRNKTNLGTVKTVNQAVKAAKGKFVLFFAADDALYDIHTLTNFATSLGNLSENEYIVSSQCLMMDEQLDQLISPFVNVPLANSLNNASASEQYIRLASSCLYAMGATAFKTSIWEQYGYFNEDYKIIEDWSFFLHVTRNHGKITYCDFTGLKHRDGGVSHFNQVVLPPHVIEYKNDLLLIQEKEILPFLSFLPREEQIRLIDRYESERKAFEEIGNGKTRVRRIDIIKQNKGLYIRKCIWWVMGVVPIYRKIISGRLPKFLISWILLLLLQAVIPLTNSTAIEQITNSMFYQILTDGVLLLFIINFVGYLVTGFLSTLFHLRRERHRYFTKDK